MNTPLLDQRYHLLETIGSGGEARIFLARDLTTQEEVAVRVGLQTARLIDLPLPAGPYAPGWVKLLRTGIDPDVGAYQVLEKLKGGSLDNVMGGRPLAYPAWRIFVLESSAAVKALHEIGLVHGDLHAGNFIFDQALSAWKLLELPFLRFQPPENRSALFGSIHTLAPEQLDGAPTDRASDLYSLGCLYYYAAAGRYPHEGATEAEVAISRLREEPVPLGDLVSDFPGEAAAGVMQLLERKPENRTGLDGIIPDGD